MKKLLLLIVLCLGLTGCGSSDTESDTTDKTDSPDVSEEKPSGEVKIYDEKADGDKISEISLSFNDKNLSGFFSVQELVSMFGFTYMDDVHGDEKVNENYSVNKSIYLYLEGTTSTRLKVQNTFSEEKTLNECLVTNFSIAIKGFEVNGVTIGEDTYDTLVQMYGKTDDSRGNNIEDDKMKNGYVMDVQYKVNIENGADEDDFSVLGNNEVTAVVMTITFDSEGVVSDINIELKLNSL